MKRNMKYVSMHKLYNGPIWKKKKWFQQGNGFCQER